MKLPAPPLNNRFRILIVEDDTAIVKLLQLQLEKTGFDCRVAINGLDGLVGFKEFDPHLVLSDISMPGLSGHELTNQIRSQSNVPVILMTAQATDNNEMQGFKNGADDYVAKPFNPQLLVARVAANLRRVYKYNLPDGPPAPVSSARPAARPVAASQFPPQNTAVPEDWATCEACNYMGPEFKFVVVDPNGKRTFVCPHCKYHSVVFSIG